MESPVNSKRTRLALTVLAAFFATSANADDAADFYRGKTIKLIVGSGVGAGYDHFARATIRYLRLPGDPQIVVQNMPGASGLIAVNYLFNIAPKDGTVIGLVNRYTVVQSIVDNKNARFDPEKFTWLGTPASYDDDPYVLVVRSEHPLKTIEDIRAAKEPLIVGGSGSDVARILGPTMGMNVKVIDYKEKNAVDIALERGEVDAMGIAYDNLRKRHPDWIEKKVVRPLVQFVRKRTARLPDVPASSELVQTPEQRALLNFVEIPLSMAYPFVVPPGVSDDKVSVIRTAFEAAFANPEYRKEIEKQGLAYSPRSGEEVAKLVKELTEAPEEAIQRYREVVGSGGGD
jgi:tripartite-type tricarboxylate transporter receptor subunit TctC